MGEGHWLANNLPNSLPVRALLGLRGERMFMGEVRAELLRVCVSHTRTAPATSRF